MKQRLLLSILIGIHIGLASAHAQAPPPVRPGSAATIIASLLTGSRYDAAKFTIHPAEGVRILGATSGVLPPSEAGTPRIPITFTMPAGAPVGEAVIGKISVEWPDGGPYVTEIRVRVEAVRKLTLELTGDRETVQPGGSARITYRVTNQGNATDTVHVGALVGAPWIASPPSESRVIPAGQMVDGIFEVRAPRTAPLGEQRQVQVRSVGRGGDAKGAVALMVTEDDAGAFGLTQIPVAVFLGGSTVGTSANLAVVGNGSIGRDTDIGVAFRRVASRQGQTYGQSDLGGPRALVSLRHGGLQAAAGELWSPMQGLARGINGAGSGLTVQQTGTAWTGGLTVARPRSWMGGVQGGHLLQANVGHAIAGGTVSARVLDLDPVNAGLSPGRREQLAGVHYALDSGGPHRFSAEAGLIRQAIGTERRAGGMSVDASYGYTAPSASISGRFRRVPDQLEGSSLAGDEASISATADLLPALRASGAAFWGARAVIGRELSDETRGASAGAQLHGFGSALGITWNLRENRSRFTLGGRERRATLGGNVSTGFGPLSLLAIAEAGVVARGELAATDVRRLQGQLRWNRPSTSAWVNVNYTDEQLLRAPLQLEAGTRLNLGEVNLDAIAGAHVQEGDLQYGYLRAGAEVYVSRSLSLVTGTEYQPGLIGSSPWTLSFGIRKTLPLPLPMRVAPRLAGRVFEDRNGNGKHDKGEPGVSGVAVSIGSTTVTTDNAGRFASRSVIPTGVPIRLVTGTLSEAYLALSTEIHVPESGRVAIPVVRAAGLDLAIFDDADGDLAHSATESSLSGISVVLLGPQGRSYSQISDGGGHARFAVLPPGAYQISVVQNGKALAQMALDLAPGGHQMLPVPLRLAARQIRMWNGPAEPVR